MYTDKHPCLMVHYPVMTSLITCSIDYYSDSVLCFDPPKILSKLQQAFPSAEIDRTDLSTAEVAWVTEYTETNSDMPDERKEMMRKQIAGKQQRVGPAYRFKISDSVSGYVNRYSIVFKTEAEFTDDDTHRIRSFMTSLGTGKIDTTELD